MSFLGDSLHDPLPDESLITHNVVVESFTVTVSVGVEPANSGETVTDRCRTCSCP